MILTNDQLTECHHCGGHAPISVDASDAYGEPVCVECWQTPEYCQSCGTVHAYADACPPCATCLRSHDAEDECLASDGEPYPAVWTYESGRLFAHRVEGVECATVEEQDALVLLIDLMCGATIESV